MSDFTQVNAGAMSQGISDLNTAYTQTENTLSTLEGELESSLAQWDGAAREAYSAAKAKWDAAANHIGQVLNQLGTVIGEAHSNYSNAERMNQGIWG